MSNNARAWSAYQQAIFSFVETGAGNAVVEAVAGSGKTTTIVEALKRVKGSSLFLAFNKSIAEELKARGVNARTFHSLTYSVVTRHKNARSIDTDKIRNLVNDKMNGSDAAMYGAFCARLVGLARQAGFGCLVNDTDEDWYGLIDHHDLELESEAASPARAVELARQLLEWSNAAATIDFDDLLYIAVKDGLALPKFDFVFVDEAQDTNAIQRAVLRKVLRQGSRLVAVGDPAQAIYGFRGADSESLNMIAEEFECTRLPLTVSYRCPQQVIEMARRWVSHIEAAPGAPVGAVTELRSWVCSGFRPEDLVLCRTTKPLIALAFALLKARVPARVMGRDIGAGMKALIGRMNARTIEQLQSKLDAYTQREVEKAVAKKQEAKAEAIQDKTDAILFLIDGLGENERTVAGLYRVIDSLFDSPYKAVLLSTIHKAKGLEAERVFWLNSSQCPAKWAKQEWQQQQERNLCYVAVTRAKQQLVLIEDKGRVVT